MDEVLLIDMMSQLYPELLENNYIEKDMKRAKLPLFKRIFSSSKKNENIFANMSKDYWNPSINYEFSTEEAEELTLDLSKIEAPMESKGNNSSLNISIFTRELPFVKIISGFVAALFVVGGIILFIIKHNKGILKIFEGKTQISY